jgi:hypothetical protein
MFLSELKYLIDKELPVISIVRDLEVFTRLAEPC